MPLSSGGTSASMDQKSPMGYDVTPRDRFYCACREAVSRAVDGIREVRA